MNNAIIINPELEEYVKTVNRAKMQHCERAHRIWARVGFVREIFNIKFVTQNLFFFVYL